MKKLLLFVLAVMGFAACTQDVEVSVIERHDTPETITVGFEGDDTRIQLNEAQKTVWNKGDLVSVFYRSDANQKWQYQGETGERVGDLKRVESAVGTTKTTKTIVVYPYSENYWLNTDSYAIEATLPAIQCYTAGSYGVGDNLMVAQSEFTQFSLKSVCGWLKLQLTGDGEVVKSITFKGKDGEQVAGLIYVDTATAEATLASEMGSSDDNNAGGNLIFDDTILTEVTLDCGEGVALSKKASSFYIALPPQIFEKGLTVEIEDVEGYVMEQSTEKVVNIERNTIQPMSAFEFVNPNTPSTPMPANNEIWYTATAKTEPYFDDALTFGANVVSNVWDSKTKKGVITFDGDVTMIGDDAFNNSDKLTGVTLPDSVTSIGKKAFYDCDGLIEFTIPDSVTSIGNSAFDSCTSLTSVTISDSVTTIGDSAFYYCTSLTEFNGKFAEDNGRILVIDGSLIAFAPAGLTEYTIPDSVTTIGDSAFYSCSSLTSVTIGDSVTTIGDSAFSSCSSLTSVTIGDSVTSIGNSAFYYCTSLKKVYCNAAVPPSIGYSVFTGNASGRRIYVYEECVDLYKSAWSSYADSIYTNGQNCPNTTIIEYTTSDGNTITPNYYAFGATIVSNTYSNGKGVITFVGDVTEIGSSAFSDCSSLTSVTIPDSVTTIGDYAFLGCSSLAEFKGKFAEDNGRILVVDGILIASAPAGLTEYTIPDSVTTIGYGAFACCESLTSVTIPDSVTTIGYCAFQACTSLTSVTIGDSVTSIGYAAFSYCDNLAEFNGKFAEDNGRIWVVDGTLIAFAPAGLTEYTIPDSVTTIGEYAFYGCSSLTSVTIGDSVITIGLTAFGYCKKLTSVTIGNSVTTIGGNAFECCDSLTSVTIPDSVTTIGFCAFQACTSLTSITIPDSVISIGAYAFQTCTNLTSVYCKAIAPPVLEGDIFRYCKGYVIFVPTESVSAYKSANRWNSYASVIVGYDF